MKKRVFLILLGLILICQLVYAQEWWVEEDGTYCPYRLVFTIRLYNWGNNLNCKINFSDLLSEIGIKKVIDFNSIRVVDQKKGLVQSSFLQDEEASEKGEVCWGAEASFIGEEKTYIIYFNTIKETQAQENQSLGIKNNIQRFFQFLVSDDPESIIDRRIRKTSKTISLIDPPILISPKGSYIKETISNQEFKWQPVTGAMSYTIEISKDTTFDSKDTIMKEVSNEVFYEWELKDLKEFEDEEITLDLLNGEVIKRAFIMCKLDIGFDKEEFPAETLGLSATPVFDDPSASTGKAKYIAAPFSCKISKRIRGTQTPALVGEWDWYVVARSTEGIRIRPQTHDYAAGEATYASEFYVDSGAYKEYYIGRYNIPSNKDGVEFYLSSGIGEEAGRDIYVEKFILRPSSLKCYWRVVAFDELGNPSHSEISQLDSSF
jgi:hypothetical protein